MPFWKQNAGNIPPRNGTAPTKNAYPASVATYGPQKIAPSQENPAGESAWGGYRAVPLVTMVEPSFGDHDALGGRLMAVSQADLYYALPQQPFPRAGTWEEPGAAVAALQLTRLAPTTSAHPGLAQATGAGPSMLFVAPPVFTIQTKPIYALGL